MKCGLDAYDFDVHLEEEGHEHGHDHTHETMREAEHGEACHRHSEVHVDNHGHGHECGEPWA